MTNFVKSLVAAVLCSSLLACASPPPDVSASVPLLSTDIQFDANYLDGSSSRKLASAVSGSIIEVEERKLTVLGAYVSALGLNCLRVVISSSSHKPYTTAACESEKGWFVTPSLMPVETN